MRFRKLGVLAVCLALSLVVVSCGGDDESEGGSASKGGGTPTKLTAILPSGPALIPTYFQWAIAKEMGYWEDEGLDVELIGLDSGSASAIQQLIADNGDISTEAPAVVVDADEEGFGDEFKIIGTWYYKQGFQLRTYTDSPIQSIDELDGKKIGVTEVAGGEVSILKAALKVHGVTDYELVPIGDGGPQTIRSLQKREVDVYCAGQKDFTGMEANGVELRQIHIPEWENLPANVFTVRTDFLADNRDATIGYMRGLAKAAVFAHENIEAAIKISQAAQEGDEIPPEVVRTSVTQTFARSVPEGLVASKAIFKVPDGAMEEFVDFYRKAGQIAADKDVDVAAISDPSLIGDINDFDFAAVEQQARDYK